jgi:surface antigen
MGTKGVSARFGCGAYMSGDSMSRYLSAIISVLLLGPQLAFAQPDSNYERRGGYGAPYDSGRDNRQYDPNRGDYRQSGDQRNYQGRYQGNYSSDQYAPGYGRECSNDQQNQQVTNAAIGAAAGGLLGNQVAGRGNRTGGTIAGVLLGAIGGLALTHQVDCGDRNYAEPTYSRGLDGQLGQRYDWRNSQDNDHGYFTPTREYTNRYNYPCRDWVSGTYRGGQRMRSSGSACRYEDGNWYFQ